MRDKDIKDIIKEVLIEILSYKEYELKADGWQDYSKPKNLSLEDKINKYINEKEEGL